jgi:hypothetical protein
MQESNWYYAIRGRRMGPVNSAQLRQLAINGTLAPTDLVWCEGMGNWAPAATLEGLIAAAAPFTAGPPPLEALPVAQAVEEPAATSGAGTAASAARQQASRLASKAATETRAAMSSTWAALKILAGDPLPGLRKAFVALGPSKALQVGITCGVFFALATVWSTYRATKAAGASLMNFMPTPGAGMGAMGFDLGWKIYFQVLLGAGVLFMAMAVVLLAARKIARGKGGFQVDLYAAGLCLAPLALLMVLAGLLGALNAEVTILLTLVAIALFVLLLYHSFTDLAGIPSKFAVYATPLAIFASFYVTKIVTTSFLFNW